MTGPQLPVTPRECDNVASPCASCDNAGENGPQNPCLCDVCEKLKIWEKNECKPNR